MNFYLFNLKNPVEFQTKGAKPVFEEIGPFVFKEIPVPPKLGYFLKLSFAYKNFLQVKCKI